jgi:hypothetical protein
LQFSATNPEVEFQSSIERDFIVLCRNAAEVIDLKWEPFVIEYFDVRKGCWRSYTPDYLMTLLSSTGKIFQRLVEVKTAKDCDRTYKANTVKYAAAEQWASQQPAARFWVATDQWMAGIGLPNIKRIDAVRDRTMPDELLTKLGKLFLNKNWLILSAILEQANPENLPADMIVPCLLKLVSNNQLHFDLDKPLTVETKFHVGESRPIFW